MLITELRHLMFDYPALQLAVFVALLSVCVEIYVKFIRPLINSEINAEINSVKKIKYHLQDLEKKRVALSHDIESQNQRITAVARQLASWQASVQQSRLEQKTGFEQTLENYRVRQTTMFNNFKNQQSMRTTAHKSLRELEKILQTKTDWPDLLAPTLEKWRQL